MIKNIEIRNFRCFRDFKLDKTRRVTLVSGRNDVGKTAFLNGLRLIFAAPYKNPGSDISSILKNDLYWEWLFNGCSAEGPIIMSLDYGYQQYYIKLEINPQQSLFPPGYLPDRFRLDSDQSALLITWRRDEPVALCYHNIDDIYIKWLNSPEHYPRPEVGYIDYNELHESNINKLSHKIDENDIKCAVLKYARKFVPELNNIYFKYREEIPYVEMSSGARTPFSSLSFEIRRFIQILLAIVNNEILLIDRIESGCPYCYSPVFWDMISEWCKQNETDIVITTHSYDCITAASTLLNSRPRDFLYVRLARDRSGDISAYTFAPDFLKYAIETDLDVR